MHDEIRLEQGDGTRPVGPEAIADVASESLAGSPRLVGVPAAHLSDPAADMPRRARLIERLDAELARTQLLLDTSVALAQALELDEVLETVVDATIEALGRSRVAVCLLDDVYGTHRVASCSTGIAAIGTTVDVSHMPTVAAGAVAAGKQAVIDLTQDALADWPAPFGCDDVISVLLTPIVFGGNHLGWLWVDEPTERTVFTDQDRELASGIASHAALAIETALLFTAQTESARLSHVLNELDHHLHEHFEVEQALPAVVDSAAASMDADVAGLLVLEGGRLRVRHAHVRPGLEVDPAELAECPCVQESFDNHQIRVIEDTRQAGEVSERRPPLWSRAALLAPMFTPDRNLGVLFFVYADEPRRFSQAERDFSRRLATSISLALNNARLFSAEHRIAETLQNALLSVPDGLEGVAFDHVYRSATDLARVGGDFYDLHDLGDGRVGVLIGDVSGKGITASVLTSLVRHTVRAYALQGHSPAEVVSLTNRTVFSATPYDMFVTMLFGVIDVPRSSIEYCNAGHPSAALVTPSDPPLMLSRTSPVVGAYPDVTYASASCPIEPGSTLVLYTDGLTEARHDGELFGEERLMRVVTHEEWSDPHVLVERLMGATLEFCHSDLCDDVAIVAIHLKPEAYRDVPRQEHLAL